MKLKMLLLAAALLFSGCLNLPDDIARGTVIADVTVYDADSGDLLADAQAYQFVLGLDNVGFGDAFEDQLDGVAVGQTLSITERGPTYDQDVSLPVVFGPLPLVQDISRPIFEAQVGQYEEGDIFEPDNSFYAYQVEALTDTTVTYRALPVDGQEDFVPELGANLRVVLNGDDTMTQLLVPVHGSTFTVEPQGQNGDTILGLQVGSYMTVGGEPGLVEYKFTPARPEVIGKNLRYEVEVLVVMPVAPAEVVDGNYGVRESHVLLGPFGHFTGDGHDHVH